MRTVGKCIKWFLLIIVGLVLVPIVLVLLLLALVLVFIAIITPFRYEAQVHKGDDIRVWVKASYLLRILRVRYEYENNTSRLNIKLLWFTLGGGKKPKREKKKKPKKLHEAEQIPATETTDDTAETDADTAIVPTPEPPPAASDTIEKDVPDDTPPSDDNSAGGPLAVFRKIRAQIQSVLTYPDRKIIIELILNCAKKLFRALLPKRLDINGQIGFDDPSTTGLFAGGYEAVAPMLGLRGKRHQVNLTANFEEPGVRVQVYTKGHIRAFSLLRPLVGLYLKKPIRRLIKYIRKGEQPS